MAAAHNAFIQGINAMVAHAPTVTPDKVQPFMVFSLAVVSPSLSRIFTKLAQHLIIIRPQVDNIHHHHDLEETFLFPEMEKKLGEGALSDNVAQHRNFVPQLLELKAYLEAVKSGEAAYGGVRGSYRSFTRLGTQWSTT